MFTIFNVLLFAIGVLAFAIARPKDKEELNGTLTRPVKVNIQFQNQSLQCQKFTPMTPKKNNPMAL